jgi:hypothetical protein
MNKLIVILAVSVSCLFAQVANAQGVSETPKKMPVYGAINFGYGNTFLRGVLGEKETINDKRGFGRNDGYAFSTFYYWAPKAFLGLGVGTGIKGYLARPNKGGDDETYSYNYYHVGIGIKDYFITKRFNEGFAFKTSIGYGPGTERMKYGKTNTYEFQNANGFTYLGGFGYAFPFKNSKSALNIDLDYEYSSKNAYVTGKSEPLKFINHHVSLNIGVIF